MIRDKRIPILTLLLLLCCSACIYQAPEDCPVELSFTYEVGTAGDQFARKIERVDVLLFDGAQRFIEKRRLEKTDLDAFQGARLNLRPGRYTLVCLANGLEHVALAPLAPGAALEDAGWFTIPQNGQHLSYDSIYTIEPSNRVLDFEVVAEKTFRETLNFTPAHLKLNVYVRGLQEMDGTGNRIPPFVEVGSFKEQYRFDLQGYGQDIDYCMQSVYQAVPQTYASASDAALAVAPFVLPLFSEDDPLWIRLFSGKNNSSLAAVDLQQFIRDHGIDLTQKQHITLDLLLTFTGANVTVSLPRWDVIPVDPELE